MEKTALSREESGLKKGPWTTEEDQKLIDYIQRHGHGRWRTLSKNAGLKRCGKSCRLRWTNYLRPDIKRGKFSFGEEDVIIRLHSILGNKWSMIAAHLPGRTDNEIKNYWNTHIRKRLLRMGIDPVTHTPRRDLLDLSSLLHSAIYHPFPNPNLLGLTTQPVVNNLSHTTTTTITSSSQLEVPEYAAHNLYNSNTQHFEPSFQDRVDSFQGHRQKKKNPNHHTTLNQSFLDEDRVTCANFERCGTTPAACNCHYCSLPKLSQYKIDHRSSGEASNSAMNNYHNGRPKPIEEPFDDNVKIQNVGLCSNLSTPSSSHTPLSSSSPLTMYGNNGIRTEDSADTAYDDNAMLTFDVCRRFNSNIDLFYVSDTIVLNYSFF